VVGRLILVEGFPGTWEQFADVRVERWRAFAAAARDYDVTVLPESALLQLPVFTMFRRNADPAAIAALVSRLVEAAAPLRPTLVYLARRDPEGAFRDIGERRGLAWLLQHAASSHGYAFTQARGLSGLEVEDDPVADATEIARVAGRYGDGQREVTVEVVDGRLVLRGILWSGNALLPIARNVFDVESWPLRVMFDADATGRIRAFRCTGPRLSWGGPSSVFGRIAS